MISPEGKLSTYLTLIVVAHGLGHPCLLLISHSSGEMTIPRPNTNKMMSPVSAGHTPKDLKKMPEQNEAKDPEMHKLPKRTAPIWTTSFPQTGHEGQVSTHIVVQPPNSGGDF